MAYEKDGYTLYAHNQPLRGGKTQTVYFFSKREPIVGEAIEVPAGYIVVVNHATGVPYLKKK